MERGIKEALDAYAQVGKWIGTVWALMVAWALTYALAFALYVFPGHEWMAYLLPLPMLVQLIVEPLFIKMEAKTFGVSK